MHHTGVTVLQTVNTIHDFHARQGWGGIGYHFYIRRDGTIFRGRPENTIGAHAAGHNHDSIGIAFEGNFETQTMPAAQLRSGQELISWLRQRHNISTIQKHRNVGATACPGRNFPFTALTTTKTIPRPIAFRVRVMVAALNIRSGAGTNHRIVGVIRDRGVYTIVEERNGWGLLLSGVGWISLNFTQRVDNIPTQNQRLTNEQVARQVWLGMWGKGQDRINRLRAAGYDPNVIQRLVNQGVGR